MRKYLFVILCLVLTASLLTVPVFAAGTVSETKIGSSFDAGEKIYAVPDGSDIIDYEKTGDGTLDETENGKVKATGTYEIVTEGTNGFLKLTSPENGKSAVAFTNNFGNKFGNTFLEFDLKIGKPLTGGILQIVSTRVAGNKLDNGNEHVVLASKMHETFPNEKGVLVLQCGSYGANAEIRTYEYELNKWYHFKMNFYDYIPSSGSAPSKQFRYTLDITPQDGKTTEIRFADTDHKNWITWGTGHKLHNAVVGLAAGTNSEIYLDNFNVNVSYVQAEVTSAEALDGKIKITFDKTMKEESFANNVELYAGNENKSIVFTGELRDTVYTITPTNAFRAGYDYTVKLKNGIKCSENGNLKDGVADDDALLFEKTFSIPMGDVKLVSCNFSESKAPVTNGVTATVTLGNEGTEQATVFGVLALYKNGALADFNLKRITVSVGSTTDSVTFRAEGTANGAAFYLLDKNFAPLCDEITLQNSILAKENSEAKTDAVLTAKYSTVDGSVTVSGKASAYDVVFITAALTDKVTTKDKNGVKVFNAEKCKTALETPGTISAAGQVMADKDGYFELCFTQDVDKFNTDNYTVVLLNSTDGAAPLYTFFAYTNPVQIERELSKINTETDSGEMMNLVVSNKGIFELEMTDYIDGVKTNVGTLMINERPESGYKNPAELEITLDKATYVARAMDKNVTLSMIKKYFGDAVFDGLSPEEQQYTANLVGGVVYTTFETFEDAFVNAQIICEASYLTTTAEAMALIGNTEKAAIIRPFEKEEISAKYNAIIEKKNVFSLMLKKNYATIAEIQNTFESAVRSEYSRENSSIIQPPSYHGRTGGGTISRKDMENIKPNNDAVTMKLFNDLGDASWAEESIIGLHAMGIIEGDGDGNFRPNDGAKREELIKILVNTFGIGDDAANSDFEDVPKDSWSYKFVSSAYKYGLVQGMGDNSFGCGFMMSRQDLMTLIYRLALSKGMISDDDEKPYLYDDYYKISDYARKAVSYISNIGLNFNIKDNKFNPKTKVSRAEAAATVWGFLKEIKE